MPSVKITELPDLPEATDEGMLPVDNGIQTYKATLEQLKDYFGGGGEAPIGSIFGWTSDVVVPLGFLKCDGSSYLRADYPELFDIIGLTYSPSDDGTSFWIPNYEGLVPRGSGSQTVNGRTKDGGGLGEVLEDQTQKLTGNWTRTNAGDIANTLTGVFSPSQSTTGNISTSGTTSAFRGINFDSATSPDARTSSTTNGETRVSSLGTIFIIKARRLVIPGDAESAIDELNLDLNLLETKQNKEKFVSCVATQRSFNTSGTSGAIVASDAQYLVVNTTSARRLNNFETLSPEYFELVNSGTATAHILIKKAGKYKIKGLLTAKRTGYFDAWINASKSGVVEHSLRPTSGYTATGATSAGNAATINIIGVVEVPDDTTVGMFAYYGANNSNTCYGEFWTYNNTYSPTNFNDTCSIEIELIEDL